MVRAVFCAPSLIDIESSGGADSLLSYSSSGVVGLDGNGLSIGWNTSSGTHLYIRLTMSGSGATATLTTSSSAPIYGQVTSFTIAPYNFVGATVM